MYDLAKLISPVRLYKINGVNFFYKYPSRYNRYLAELIYEWTMEDCFEIHTRDSLMNWMLNHNYWSKAQEERLVGLQEDLDKLKIEYYKSKIEKTELFIKKKIIECKGLIKDLFAKKYAYDYLTREYVAEHSRERFLVGCGLYIGKKRYWKNPLEDWKTPDDIVESAIFYINKDKLSEDRLREIARSKEFKSIWSVKGKFINKYNVDLPDDLRDLIGWAQMYDSIASNPESPSDKEMDDPDKVDGWILFQREKHEKNKFAREMDEIVRKHKGAGEIFVAADDKLAKKIYDFNDDRVKKDLKERREALEKHGVLREDQMPDVKREIEMAMNRAKNG